MAIHGEPGGYSGGALPGSMGCLPSAFSAIMGFLNPQALPSGQALLILIPSVLYTVRRRHLIPPYPANLPFPAQLCKQSSLINSPTAGGRTIVIAFEEEKQRRTVNGYAYPYIREDILRRASPTSLSHHVRLRLHAGRCLDSINDRPLIRRPY